MHTWDAQILLLIDFFFLQIHFMILHVMSDPKFRSMSSLTYLHLWNVVEKKYIKFY